MKRLCQYLIVFSAAAAVLATGLPEAEAARKSSLAESRLILDKNDVYFFPQLSVEYTNLASLEYGAVDGSGSGLLLLGDESMAFGIGIYRGDLLTARHYFPHGLGNPNLGNVANNLALFGFPQPHTVVDLFAGMDIGGGVVGGRVFFGNGGERSVDNENQATGESHTFVGATLGYSMFGDFRLDAGLNFQLGSGTAYVEDDDTFDGSYLLVGLNTRGYSALGPDVDLGFLFDFYFRNWSLTVIDPDDPDVTGRINELSTFAGAGPVYNIGETTLATYGVLGFLRAETDPNVDEDHNREVFSNIVVPGVHLAADIEIFEWLYFRTGMQYNFSILGESQEIDPDDFPDSTRDDETFQERTSGFGWRAGLGLQLDNFTLDGVFQSGFVTGGPDFLGGNATGMFTMVSAGYQF